MAKLEKSLLPQGFYDHLPPEAMREMKLNSVIINQLTLFGYELVRPAMVEFEESLDKDFSSDFFKITDTISGKMMVIRNDITPQIARIVKDRYGSDALGKTVRLAYSGQVIRKYGQGKFTERQLTQTGFELIAADDARKDAEILYIASEAYEKAGITDFTIDICYPKLAGILLREKNFTAKEIEQIVTKIETKDIQDLQNNEKLTNIVKIIKLSDEAFDLPSAIDVLSKIEALDLPKEAKDYIGRIKQSLNIISNSDQKKVINNISLNLLENMGFTYHSGFCYSFISNKTLNEIGRGGRYKISLGKDSSLDAAGFTFLINSMITSSNITSGNELQNLNYDVAFTSSRKLREKNITTIFE